MINIVELFSGIGSQAKAFERLSKTMQKEIKVLNTCEWDIHAIVAYDYIHNGAEIDYEVKRMSKKDLLVKLTSLSLSNDGKKPLKKRTLESFSTEMLKRIYSSIKRTNNLISVNDIHGKDLPNDITVLTYSFPCQDLSNVGALHGYNKGIDRDAKTRSGLLWEVERILCERKNDGLDLPKFLLLENVTSLESKRHSKNFEEWKSKLEELGYYNHVNRLYAPDFGIPQNRKRLLMLSVYVGKSKTKLEKVRKYFEKNDLNNKIYLNKLNLCHYNLIDFLRLDYNNNKLYLEALEATPNNTPSRNTIWEKNNKIIDENGRLKNIVSTITTKQDRHPNSGNIFFLNKVENRAQYRFLTPRECFLLMGYDEADFEALINNNFNSRQNSLFFSRDKLYKLAGNSIVVNMLEAIFMQVIELNKKINGAE